MRISAWLGSVTPEGWLWALCAPFFYVPDENDPGTDIRIPLDKRAHNYKPAMVNNLLQNFRRMVVLVLGARGNGNAAAQPATVLFNEGIHMIRKFL